MAVEGNATVGYVVGTGTFAATGAGVAVPLAKAGSYNVTLSGTFVAAVAVERSFDGTTWYPLCYNDGTAVSFTAAVSTPIPETERGVQVRLNCTWTSGTVTWRVSQ